MVCISDENKVADAIHFHLFDDLNGFILLEHLINRAEIGKELFNIPSAERMHFSLSNDKVKVDELPIVERLSLVIPESFSFEWKLYVSGLCHIKYKAIDATIPQQISNVSILYTGVVVVNNENFAFKNEYITLL